MFKIIKKSLIILLLLTINVIAYIVKSIQDFYKENKSKIEKYSKSFYCVLKEELDK
jgi:hypothetical protein